jgi:hypothetical protein
VPTEPLASLQAHFGGLKDPRLERSMCHQLLDIITIAICAVISGADSWVDVAAWGQTKQARSFIQPWPGCSNGCP